MLTCECGEKLILLGRQDDWHSEGHTSFRCGGCEASLQLAVRAEEQEEPEISGEPEASDGGFDIRDYLRQLRGASRG